MTQSPSYDDRDRTSSFFGHGDRSRPRSQKAVNSVTRYLAGAAYLDEGFADRMTAELIEDRHRAVVPAIGFDLAFVLKHCFRARRIWLVQDCVLLLLVLGGLVLATRFAAVVLGAALVLSLVSWRPRRSEPSRLSGKVLGIAALGLLGILLLAGPLITYLRSTVDLGGSSYDDYSDYPDASDASVSSSGWSWLGGIVLFAALLFAVVLWTRLTVLRILGDQLAPGTSARKAPEPPAGRAGKRLGVVDLAQYGNVLMHSGYRPFLGAGEVVEAWSLAMELRSDGEGDGKRRRTPAQRDGADPITGRADGADPITARVDGADPTTGPAATVGEPDRAPGGAVDPAAGRPLMLAPEPPGAPPPVPIDPVLLNQYVKRRLAALRDEGLPQRERIFGLALRDQIIASGTHWQRHPLIDRWSQRPYAQASPEAVEMIIRHPQASARHFLRAVVSIDAQAVADDDGTVLLPASSQTLTASAFMHIAVEGGMLYLEFVSTVLGPILPKYRVIDRYAAKADALVWPAVAEAVRRFGPEVIGAPIRLLRALGRAGVGAWRSWRADHDTSAEPLYDFGARLDVRELGSMRAPATYLQRLDAAKYLKLVEKRISEAILDFLEAEGIDTTEFRSRINFVQDNSVKISGNAYGPVTGGRENRVSTKPAEG